MKKYRYSARLFLLIEFFAMSLGLSAQEVTKEYHKEFATTPNTALEIDSRYGNVAIESWDKEQIVIDVIVRIEMPSKTRAEKALGDIEILISEDGNTIKARTQFSKDFNIISFGRGMNLTINYNIKMPLKTTLKVSNSYGNTQIMNELAGLVNLNIRYGDFSIDKLSRGNEKPWNNISIAYGKGNIESAEWMSLNLSYSNINISKSSALLIEGRYSDINIGEVSSVVCETRYGKVNVHSIKNLDMTNGYTGVRIGTLASSLKYESSYGPLTVDNIPAGFESIDINARYSDIKLGISNSAGYTLNGEARYGGIRLNEDNFEVRKRIIENNRTTLTGVVGKDDNPTSKVNINANYTNVRLSK